MTGKRLAALLGAGLAAAQAGHLAAFALRYGGTAIQLQTTGAHAYFPTLARTGLGLAAAFALAVMLVVGLARLAGGRRIVPGSAPTFWRLLPLLYTVQLACFGAQETLEALLGGGHASSAPLLLLWGAAGQLPVALLTAVVLRWLLARLEPALDVLRPHSIDAFQLLGGAVFLGVRPLGTVPVAQSRVAARDVYRGPPSF